MLKYTYVKHTLLLLLCLNWLLGKLLAQQDVQFSQYVFNGITVNPAYAGYKEDWYFSSVYRHQWTTFPGAPKTASASVDGLLSATQKQMGLGGQLAWDKLGPQEAIALYGSYAYRIQLEEEDTRRLCLGLSLGITQYGIDGSVLQPTDNNDPNIPTGKMVTYKPDARFGIYYYTPTYYAGLSFMDLFAIGGQSNIYFNNNTLATSFQKLMHMYLTAGCIWNVSDDWILKPSFLLKEDFKGPTSVDLNLLALLSKKLWVGGSYRTALNLWKKSAVNSSLDKKGAASAVLQFFATEKLRIGYSYDIVTSGLSGYQSGSHEISIGLLMSKKADAVRIKSPRYF